MQESGIFFIPQYNRGINIQTYINTADPKPHKTPRNSDLKKIGFLFTRTIQQKMVFQ